MDNFIAPSLLRLVAHHYLEDFSLCINCNCNVRVKYVVMTVGQLISVWLKKSCYTLLYII